MAQTSRGLLASLADELAGNKRFYALFLCTLLGLLLLLRPGIAGPDTESYLAYTRSLFFDGDILLCNELPLLGKPIFIVPGTLYAVEIRNVGTALFWLPFYALAYLLTLLPSYLWLPAESGLGPHYIALLNAGNWLYGALALLLTYALCRRHFSRGAAALACGLVCLGTPYFYYMASLSPNPHMPALFLTALFAYLWDGSRGQRSKAGWAVLGVLAGLMVSVANYNVTLAVLPALELALTWWRRRDLGLVVRSGALFALSALLGAASLPLSWWILFGSPVANPYLQIYFWLQPAIVEVLFSSYHGLYFFAPLLFLCTLGLYPLWRKDRELSAASLLVFAAQTYIISAALTWWGGASFGARYFIGLSPFFSLGLAALIEWSRGRLAVRLLGAAALILCLAWTFLLFMQGVAGLTVSSLFFPADSLWRRQWEALAALPGVALQRWLLPERPLPLAYVVLFAFLAFVVLRTADGLLRGKWPKVRPALPYLALAAPFLFALLLLLAAWRGDQARAELIRTGFYDRGWPRVNYDPLDLSGAFYERAIYLQETGRPDEATWFLQRASDYWPDKSRKLLLAGEKIEYTGHSELFYGGELRLLGYKLERQALPPGTQAGLTLYWQRWGRDAPDFVSTARLVGRDGQIYGAAGAEDQPLPPYPVRFMPPKTSFSDTLILSVAPQAPGPTLRLMVEAYGLDDKPLIITDSQDRTNDGLVGYVKTSPPARAEYKPAQATDFNLGGWFKLLGYDLERSEVSPGQTVGLVLYWRAEAEVADGYTVFVHLIGPDAAHIVAQQDNPPQGGWYPTSLWSRGELVRDPYELFVPPDTPPGEYEIEVGMYWADDGSRLPLLDERGHKLDDRILLASLAVK
jgi:hypothetical protein